MSTGPESPMDRISRGFTPADWTQDERRGWAINSVREEIKSLRAQARICRARFRLATSHYYQPGEWVASCYDAAAEALQECIDSLPANETLSEGRES